MHWVWVNSEFSIPFSLLQETEKKERQATLIMKERGENKSGVVFVNYINFIITNIKFKICTYCKCLIEMIFINIYGLTILINS